MPPFHGSGFELHVNTTGSTYIIVNDMDRYERAVRRNATSVAVFGRATNYSIPGSRDVTFTVSGFLSDTDAGQATLRTSEAADTPVLIKVMFDGANGFTQSVLVGSTTHSASPEGLQAYSFEFSATADPVIVGTGPLL